MKQSKLEINVRRLLAKCELIAKDNSEDDWRLEKFIGRLDEMVAELQKIPKQTFCHQSSQGMNCCRHKELVYGIEDDYHVFARSTPMDHGLQAREF